MELPILSNEGAPPASREPLVALLGNPNAGKTTLFNSLTGLRATTANYPGTTVEHRRGKFLLHGLGTRVVDLPGLYDLQNAAPDEQISRRVLLEGLPDLGRPDVIILVVDATNLQRNLFLAGQVLELQRPTIVALNMTDVAESNAIRVNVERLSQLLHCPVVPIAARSGRNLEELRRELHQLLLQVRGGVDHYDVPPMSSCTVACGGCQYAARHAWAEEVSHGTLDAVGSAQSLRRSMAIDRVATHPVGGLLCFAAVMLITFMLIFWLATFPMQMIEQLFDGASSLVSHWLPKGDLRSLITDGMIGGVGGMLVFLPQICILFFFLSLLEDSGYLARAALVMDQLMRHVGLPGKAFIPMLSAHACAIPAIMSSRVIEDRRDRLIAILIIPLMSCSARVPVYAMLTALLFPHRPGVAALAFSGAYFLGIVSALVVAWLLRRFLLPGAPQPLLIELPNYRLPSLKNAWLLTVDRAWAFIKNAGTVILVISLILWALATYPKVDPQHMPSTAQAELTVLQQAGDAGAVELWRNQAQLEHSWAGRLGKAVQPVFAPLGFDWKMSVGVVTSFAAREVIVSSLAILYGMGEETAAEGDSFYGRLATLTRPDGSLVFSSAACWSLLVFYVLAMQCLPTQAVTRRETGSWRWAAFQLAYMTVLAYAAAWITYLIASHV